MGLNRRYNMDCVEGVKEFPSEFLIEAAAPERWGFTQDTFFTGGGASMTYKTCRYCGSNNDPGERCDCQRAREENEGRDSNTDEPKDGAATIPEHRKQRARASV